MKKEEEKKKDYYYLMLAIVIVFAISPWAAVFVFAGGISPIILNKVAESFDE